MSLQVKLKLKLNKEVKHITVKYNTFEPASFDEYLVASIALRAKDDKEAYSYIDEITGSGSLNPHFKKMYEKAMTLTKDQLEAVMSNSLYPVLKIDKSNSYVYFPELNVSVFNKKTFEGDFGEYPDLIERLYIKENVIDYSVSTGKIHETPEPYTVQFNTDQIKVSIYDKWINITNKQFTSLYCNELDSIDIYKGQIHTGADGIGWNVLTNYTIGNMLNGSNYFYENGDHYLIRNDDVRKTTLSRIADLYIYKEEIIPYDRNRSICERTLSVLRENNSINEFKTKSLIKILSNCDDLLAQDTINYILARKDSKELALLGLQLISNGLEKNWNADSHLSFLKYAETRQLSMIYKINPQYNYTVEQLLAVNPNYLTAEHKKTIENYYFDIEQKRQQYKAIIGEVTASSLREKVKTLRANDDTKRFTKLANELIGHSNINIDKADKTQLDNLLKKAIELKEIATKLQNQLDENG